MTNDPIGDELHKLNEEFRKLLGLPSNAQITEKTTTKELVQSFGLTIDEAKAWLEHELDYKPSDECLHDRRNRRGLDSTIHCIRWLVWQKERLFGTCQKCSRAQQILQSRKLLTI